MPKVSGSVFLIEKGKQTQKVVDAEEAFSDLEQAKAQVLFFEKKGERSGEETRPACLPSMARKTIPTELRRVSTEWIGTRGSPRILSGFIQVPVGRHQLDIWPSTSPRGRGAGRSKILDAR